VAWCEPRDVRLERRERNRVALVVLERRGAVVWVRRGHAGGAGRITSIPCADDGAAQRCLEAELAARVADGFALTDPDATVSDPFRAHDAEKRRRRFAPREVGSRIENGLPRLPAPFSEVLDAMCRAAAVETTMRLARLELEVDQGDRSVSVELTYAAGSGENVDDYDFESVGFTLVLERVWSEPSDGVELDVFVDELRPVRGTALVTRFAKAVGTLRDYSVLRAIEVIDVERRE